MKIENLSNFQSPFFSIFRLENVEVGCKDFTTILITEFADLSRIRDVKAMPIILWRKMNALILVCLMLTKKWLQNRKPQTWEIRAWWKRKKAFVELWNRCIISMPILRFASFSFMVDAEVTKTGNFTNFLTFTRTQCSLWKTDVEFHFYQQCTHIN